MAMARWKTLVKLGDLHAKHEAGELTLTETAKDLAKRLRATPYAAELESLLLELENVDTVDEYDEALSALYDFGDEDKRIWFEMC